MNISIFQNADEANSAASNRLAGWLTDPSVRTFMPAAGNTPLDLYRRIAERRLPLDRLSIFTLDEYVGVPLSHPRNCTCLLRKLVAQAWGSPENRFFGISSLEEDALSSVRRHEQLIRESGGIDVLVLGLGQNGHLGFNEPGSAETSEARVLDLEPISIEANQKWFDGKHAPAKGVTVGLSTLLRAHRILIMAYGKHKTAAVGAMIRGPRDSRCPASFLQGHPEICVFLDTDAAAGVVNASGAITHEARA